MTISKRLSFSLLVCPLAMFSLLAIGCSESTTARHTGDDGYLVFEYHSTEDLRNFNKPLQRGARLDLFVSDVPRGQSAEILSVTPLSPETALVKEFEDNRFNIWAISPGWARFEVVARDSHGEERTDTVRFRVDDLETLTFRPHRRRVYDLPSEEKVHRLEVPPGTRVEIPWTRRSAKDEPLVGYGFYPLVVTPRGEAEIDQTIRSQGYFQFHAPDEATTFTIHPADGIAGDRLVVTVTEGAYDSRFPQVPLLQHLRVQRKRQLPSIWHQHPLRYLF